jgi:hypothetical protein
MQVLQTAAFAAVVTAIVEAAQNGDESGPCYLAVKNPILIVNLMSSPLKKSFLRLGFSFSREMPMSPRRRWFSTGCQNKAECPTMSNLQQTESPQFIQLQERYVLAIQADRVET